MFQVLSLEAQMIGFVGKNIGTNALQKCRAGPALKGRVIRNGDDFSHHQHAQAQFKAGKLTHTPENPIHPVLLKHRHAFTLQETRQVAAVPLLFFDEQLQ